MPIVSTAALAPFNDSPPITCNRLPKTANELEHSGVGISGRRVQVFVASSYDSTWPSGRPSLPTST